MFIFQMLLRWNSKQTNIQNYWGAIIWLCCFAKKTTNGLLKSPSDQETKEKMFWQILNHIHLTCSNDLTVSNTSCPCFLSMF